MASKNLKNSSPWCLQNKKAFEMRSDQYFYTYFE